MSGISIIVPIYNVETYLSECLDSIINQTFKDIEIILVNDGSIDNSLNVCEQYAKKDSRIVIFNKKNGGVSSARNMGIDNAKGEYLSFIDPDDYVDLRMCEILYNKAKSSDADLVVAGYHRFDNATKRIIKSEHNIEDEDKILDLNSKEDRAFMGRRIPYALTSACARLYRKEIFNKLRFPVGLKYEDTFIYMPVLNLSRRIVLIPDYLYFYRINRPNSIMTTHSQNKLDIEFIDVTSKFAEEYYQFISKYDIKLDFVIKLYRRLYALLVCYDCEGKYDIQKSVIVSRLKFFSNKDIKSRYKWEIMLICNYPNIYKYVACKRL